MLELQFLDHFCIPVLILTAVNNHHHLDLCSTDNVSLLSLSPSSRTNVTNFVSLSPVLLQRKITSQRGRT